MTTSTFQLNQPVILSMDFFEGTTGTVVETPDMREDGKLVVLTDEATQWHDDGDGGEHFIIEAEYVHPYGPGAHQSFLDALDAGQAALVYDTLTGEASSVTVESISAYGSRQVTVVDAAGQTSRFQTGTGYVVGKPTQVIVPVEAQQALTQNTSPIAQHDVRSFVDAQVAA